MGYSSKVPTDPNMTSEVRSFLDDVAKQVDGITLASLGITGDIITHDADEFFAVANNLSEATAAVARSNISAASKSQTEFVAGSLFVATTIDDYEIIEDIPFGATLTSFSARLSGGTATLTPKINTTGVTGGVISATSSKQTKALTALNTMVATDYLRITVSALSTNGWMNYSVTYTRTLS